jgi:hypothetical protein
VKEELLRQSYERILTYRAETGGDRSACPSIDQLQALVSREGPEAARLNRLDHVMGCPFCRAEFEMLRALGSARPVRRIPVQMVGLAASVLLVIGAGLLWRSRHPSSEPLRGGGAYVLLRSPADHAILAGPPPLAWQPVAGAIHYRVEILTPDGVMVWQGVTTDSMLSPPDSVPLTDSVAYRWLVEAEETDGTLVRSDLRQFTLRRP